jgi:uncharacterized membrane protein
MRWLLSILLLTSCTKEPEVIPDTVTYTQHIKPIIQNRCSMCHYPGYSKGYWGDYGEAYAKRDLILYRAVTTKTMPPGGVLSKRERLLIEKWVATGAKK